MLIRTFHNNEAVICGKDSMRIRSKNEGILSLCGLDLSVSSIPTVLPVIANGNTGTYSATFTSNGITFNLKKVVVRNGRISPLSELEADVVELQIRADEKDNEILTLKKEIEKLQNIFDTNSLNFLINS